VSDGPVEDLPDDPEFWSDADRATYAKRVRDATLEYLAGEHEPEGDMGELDENEPPWADPPDDLDPEPDATVPDTPRPRRPRRGLRVRDSNIHYTVDGQRPPDEVRQSQWAFEHSYGLLLGQDLHGASALVSWSDSIGPGRESRNIQIRFSLNEALQPIRPDEFSPFPLAAYLFVSVGVQEAWLDQEGKTRRTFSGHVEIRDALNGRVVGSKREAVVESPVTAARIALQRLLASPVNMPLSISDDRPLDDLPYEVRPVQDRPVVKVPPGFLPRRFRALYDTHFGVKYVIGLIMLLAVGIPIALLVRNGPTAVEVEQPSIEAPASPTGSTEPQPDDEAAANRTGESDDSNDDEDREEVEPTTEQIRMPAGLRPLGPPASRAPVAFFPDPRGGISWSILGTPGVDYAPTNIVEFWVAVATWSNTMLSALFNNSSYPCGAATEDYRVTCPIGAGLLDPDDEYFVIGVEHEGPVGEGARSFTYGLAFDDDGDESDNYQFAPPFTADFFRNTEHWYRLQIDEDGTRTMWADSARDGTLGYPRFSSALVIETGNAIVWVIPRSEIPGDQPAFRATAFHNNGEPGDVPDPAKSGGDVSGETVLEPLTSIDLGPVVFDDLTAVPADIEDPQPRVAMTQDPDAYIARVLTEELESRLNTALADGDTEAVAATVHPSVLNGPKAEACRSEVDSTIALADSIEFSTYPGPPDTSALLPAYTATARINYSTGAVDWGPVMAPGPKGRLYLILPSCL